MFSFHPVYEETNWFLSVCSSDNRQTTLGIGTFSALSPLQSLLMPVLGFPGMDLRRGEDLPLTVLRQHTLGSHNAPHSLRCENGESCIQLGPLSGHSLSNNFDHYFLSVAFSRRKRDIFRKAGKSAV